MELANCDFAYTSANTSAASAFKLKARNYGLIEFKYRRLRQAVDGHRQSMRRSDSFFSGRQKKYDSLTPTFGMCERGFEIQFIGPNFLFELPARIWIISKHAVRF